MKIEGILESGWWAVDDDPRRRGFDENGVLNSALTDFLLDPASV